MSQAKKTEKPKQRTKAQEAIIEALKDSLEQWGRRLILEGKKGQKDWSRMTQKRLYAYPVLKQNVKRYRLDIEDIKKEDMGKSKSIVAFYTNSGGGKKPDLEDLRAAKIRVIEAKIDRDAREIAEIDNALSVIESEKYCSIIAMRYFEKKSEDEIIAETGIKPAMLPKEIGKLLDILNVALYGADALVR